MERTTAATAGLDLLASLLGASAKEEEEEEEVDDGGDAGGAGSKRCCRRESFHINLFPDNPIDAAQAKDGDEVRGAEWTFRRSIGATNNSMLYHID